jgi:hypothetical protein
MAAAMGKGDGVNRRSVWRMAVVLLALTTAGVACGSGGGSGNAKESNEAPEAHQAPAAQVTAGLGKIGDIANQVGAAAAADAKSAKALDAGIEPVWEQIEGTVRTNDKDLYIRFEDDFAALSKAASAGDGAKAQQTSADIADAIKSYLARFPG